MKILKKLKVRLGLVLVKAGTATLQSEFSNCGKWGFVIKGDEWSVQKYQPKHYKGTGTREYWKDRDEEVNKPGFEKYLVLDTFEKRLP